MLESLIRRRVRVKFGPAAGQTGWVVDSFIVDDATHFGIVMDATGNYTNGGFARYKLETTHAADADKIEWAAREEKARAAKAQLVPDVSGRSGLLGRGRR